MRRVTEAAEPDRPHDPAWYLDDVATLAASVVGSPPEDQRRVLAQVARRFRRNADDNDRRVLSPEQVDALVASAAAVARACDPDVLAGRVPGVPAHLLRYLASLAGHEHPEAVLEVRSLLELRGELRLYAMVVHPSAGELTVRVHARGATTRTLTVRTLSRRTFRYFGRPLLAYPCYDLRLPLDALPPGARVTFAYAGRELALTFATASARLAPDLGCDYARLGTIAVLARPDALVVRRPTHRAAAAAEVRAFRGLLGAGLSPRRTVLEGGLRVLRHLTRGLYGPRLVLYFDKLYMGGDNGQHLFEHATSRQAGGRTRHRYLVRGDTATARDLRARGLPIVDARSPLRKLAALHAHVLAATHADVWAYAGLNPVERRWFAPLLNAHVVCLQHGLTVQHLPQYQARWVDNTERYYCAAHAEVANLGHPAYGYDPDALRLTGAPRYDGLVPARERLVVVAPTWRRSAANDVTTMGGTRAYSDHFTGTPYFAAYSALLTHRVLLDGLRVRGFRLRFLVHPTLSAQRPDLAAVVRPGDPVEVVDTAATGYVGHLRAASVAVTDFSGVQFDLAALRTPIVYYLPDALPPHYRLGAFDPRADGFGPVADTLDDLAAQVLAAADAGVPAEHYASRIDAFFAHHDRRNCERVYADLAGEYDLD